MVIRRRSRAGLVAALAFLAPTAAVAALGPGAGCALSAEQADRWHRVGMPAGATSLAQLDDDPCTMLAAGRSRVWRSENGGRSWHVVRRAAGSANVEVFGEDLGFGRLAVAETTPGATRLFLSHDRGRTFVESSGVPAGTRIAALATSVNSRDRLLLSAAPQEGVPIGGPAHAVSAIFESLDGGRTFTPVAGNVRLAPTRFAFSRVPEYPSTDPAERSAPLLANGVPGATSIQGVWITGLRYATPGAHLFRPSLTETVADFDLAFGVQDGGEVVYAATPTGLRRMVFLPLGPGPVGVAPADPSYVRQETWEVRHPGPVTAVRIDSGVTGALLAIGDGRVLRSLDGGRTLTSYAAGLPADCRAADLRRAALAAPAPFLVRCADGRHYRSGSSTATLRRARSGGSGGSGRPGGGGPGGGLPTDYLQPIRTLQLPATDGTSDGSLAFDGHVLLYSGTSESAIHRMSPVDGRPLPDLRHDLPIAGRSTKWLTYDPDRDVFYVRLAPTNAGPREGMYRVDPRTGKTTRLFATELGISNAGWAFDRKAKAFVTFDDSGSELRYVDLKGHVVRRCDVVSASDDEIVDRSPMLGAAVAPAGDGSVYVQNEDDSSVVHVTPDCVARKLLLHRVFSEPFAENDAMACDSVTFGIPALWIRDAAVGAVTAYAVPTGYCPVPTRLALAHASDVPWAGSLHVCARLTQADGATPVAGQPLEVAIDGQAVVFPFTGDDGRSCAWYAPRGRLLRPGEPEDAQALRAARRPHHVAAAFRGTVSYLPSSARSAFRVLHAPIEEATGRPGSGIDLGVPVPPAPPQLVVQHLPQQAPQSLPQLRSEVVGAQQPAPQANAQPLAVGVPQQQEQQQTAEVTVTTPSEVTRQNLQATRARRQHRPPPSLLASAALLAAVGYAYATRLTTQRVHREG